MSCSQSEERFSNKNLMKTMKIERGAATFFTAKWSVNLPKGNEKSDLFTNRF